MSVLFGGGKQASQPQNTPQYTGLQVQSSAVGLPIALMWGKTRLAPNLIWAPIGPPAFQTIPHTTVTTSGGGKGGGSGGSTSSTSYTYMQALLLALANTEIDDVPELFIRKAVSSLSAEGLTLFQGTTSQSAFGYISTNYPSQARNYRSIAYLAGSALDLGSSADIPQISAICTQELSGVSVPGVADVNLADVIPDFLTNQRYGLGISSSAIGDLTSCRAYWTAQGLLFSPRLTSQEKASDVLNRWAQLSNAWFFWAGDELMFVPLGTETVTGNGVTFTPDLTAAYDLTTDHFIVGTKKGDVPVTVEISNPADAVNQQQLSTLDSSNYWNSDEAEWKDDGLIEQYGTVTGSVIQAEEITNKTVGAIAARLIGKRGAYIRRTYKFKLGWQFIRLIPGSIVTLTEPNIPLAQQKVRITQVDEDDKGGLAFQAEELVSSVGSATLYTPQAASNVPANYLVSPGDVNTPAIFEPAASLTGGMAQVWLGLSGGADWGGADVWLSFDDVTFNRIGSVTNPCRQGVTLADFPSHADPDSADTLSVDLTESQGVLPASVTTADADAFRSLFILGIGSSAEIGAYGNSALGASAFKFDLTYIRRGLYGTPIGDHPSGTGFCRIDDTIFKFDLPAAYVGAPLYFKFPSFNRFGGALQDLASAATYTYTPSGTGFGGGAGGVPLTPTGLGATGGTNQVALAWSANPPSDGVTLYKLYRGTGHLVAFSSCTLIASVNALSYVDTGLAGATEYTYYLVAHNAIGDSGHEGPVDGTTS